MKKTFTINISGTIFHIEDDAYEKLQGYLVKLKEYFGSSNEGREIVADFEARIAELFLEKSKGESKVVVTGWVEEVISVMGTPDDFRQQGEGEEVLTGEVRRKRRLYRDAEKKVIGGVCSGLGAYFNIDPVILRILFVVLFFTNGIGLLAYLVLWIAVPVAKTTAQRLEMRGREVSISNIGRSFHEGEPAGEEPVPESAGSTVKETAGKNYSRGSGVAGDVFDGVLKFFVMAVGIVLIAAGFFGLLGFVSSLAIGQSFLSGWPLAWNPDFNISGLINQFVSPETLTVGMIAIAFIAGIPLLAMLFVGTKLVFRYKSNNTAIGMGMLGLWMIALLVLVLLAASEAGNYKQNTSLSASETIVTVPGKNLYLMAGEDKFASSRELDWDLDRFKVVSADGETILLGKPTIDIEKSATSDCVVIVSKKSRGKNQADANDNIRKILYKYEFKDTTLVFDPWFFLGEDGKWRDQRVHILLKLPEGSSVHIGENLANIIYDIENVTNTWDRDMVGKTWTMLPEGLSLKDNTEAAKESAEPLN